MRQFRTRGIVLRRVDFGEADRVITFITPDEGLVSAMVKGVRKQGSKLAGGIELFSESDLTFVKGKGELDHLISSRLITHYRHIVKDYERVSLGYLMISVIEKSARHYDDAKLYELLAGGFAGLDNLDLSLTLIEAWFRLQLLVILGQQPNLTHDTAGQKLAEGTNYTLLPDDGAFKPDDHGDLTSDHIKAWRVLLRASPAKAAQIGGVLSAIESSLPQLRHLFEYQLANY